MLHDFQKWSEAAESACSINSELEKDTVPELTVQDGLARYCTGDHNAKDRPQSNCLSELNDERLRQVVLEDP